MDLYQKPTDTKRCLPFSSSHPNHCKANIPFNLARRICTIVENNKQKELHLAALKENLIEHQYPKSIISKGFEKALAIPQNTLRQPKETTTNNNNILAFISTHNPNNPAFV